MPIDWCTYATITPYNSFLVASIPFILPPLLYLRAFTGSGWNGQDKDKDQGSAFHGIIGNMKCTHMQNWRPCICTIGFSDSSAWVVSIFKHGL